MNIDMTTLLVGVLPAVFSGLFSYTAARHAAKKDMDSLKLQWQHERDRELDAQLSALLRAVTEFCHSDLGYDPNILSEIMAFRAVALPEWDAQLAQLYEAVATEDRLAAEACALSLVSLRQDRKP